MPKEEWGIKRLCPHCASRFYDLTNDPMTCPVCGASFSAESLQIGRGRVIAADKASTSTTAAPSQDTTDDDDLDEDGGEVDLDDDLLEDDDDDDTVSLDDIADVSSGDDDS
ncbi:TIGR02300 family protein [Phaeovulum sp.]|uniref:TIGR02300 family protein n=1 Tax=Phaeovulum sp. TaxID=2934796 RepID=UPI0039E30F94